MKSNPKGNKELTTKVVLDKKTTKIDAPNPTKSIEYIAEVNGEIPTKDDNKPKRFLTKKRIILFLIFTLISLGFTLITIFPILRVDWKSFNVSVGTGIAQNWGWLWMFLILVQLFVNINRGFFTFIPRLKSWGYHISYKDYMLYSLTYGFIASVSPGNLVSDPYTIFWLKTHGIPTSRAVSMFFTNSFMWQIAQILVTLPFFIVCCVHNQQLRSRSPLDAWLFWMICIGVAIDFIGLLFFFLLNWSKTFHYYSARLFNWFKKIFHMKYHTKEETAKKYKEKAALKQSFYESMKDWKTTCSILGAWILGDLLGLIAMVWCLDFVQNVIVYANDTPYIVRVDFDIGWTLVCARLAVPANRLNFLPGQAMGFPASLMELLNVYGGLHVGPAEVTKLLKPEEITTIQKNVISNGLLAGQIFLNWVPAFIGIIGFIILTRDQIKLSNEGKLFAKK